MKMTERLGQVYTASTGLRLANLIIDGFVVQLLNVALVSIPFFNDFNLLFLILHPAYYIFMEYYMQATLGKLITQTTVLNENGQNPDLRTIILRTFLRYIPFEAFSFLGDSGRGWHDKWSKTFVVMKSDVSVIQERLETTPNSFVERKDENKNKKILILGFIILLLVGASYVVSNQIDKYLTGEITDVFDVINAEHYEKIEGEWESDWILFEKLHFQSDNVLIATNTQGIEVELEYKIETSSLIITDGGDLELIYLLMNLSEDEILLKDLNDMKTDIILKKI